MKIGTLISQLQKLKKQYGKDIQVGVLTRDAKRKPQFNYLDLTVAYIEKDDEIGPPDNIIGICLTKETKNA